MSTSAIGIKIDIQGKKAEQTVDRLSNAFEKLERSLNKTQNSTKKTTKGMNNLSDQGIANIQAGLVQLSTYLLNLSVGIDNTFDKMLTRFKKMESASVQLKIALGLPGLQGNALDEGNKRFGQTEKLVKRLAATTEYTANEVFDALRNLTTAGFSPEDAERALAPVLKFVTASGGQIALAEGIDIARLSVQTLGQDIGNLEDSLNILAKGTTKTAIGFSDLQSALGGVGAAAMSFGGEDKQKRLASLFAIAAGQKAIGAEARGSGDMVRQFGNALTGMGGDILMYEKMLQTGKSSKRVNKKRMALFEMLGLNISKKALGVQLKMNAKELKGFSIEMLKVRRAKELLGTYKTKRFTDKNTGEETTKSLYEHKEADELLKVFLDRYKKIASTEGQKTADEIFQKGFGREAGTKALKGLYKLMLTSNTDSLDDLLKIYTQHNNVISHAQKESLKTLHSRIKLAESAEDAFSNTIFAEDSMYKGSLDTYTAVVTALNEIVSSNKGLATGISATGRAAQVFTKVGTNMGFMLTAAATFSIALNHAQKSTGVAITTLGGTMRAFHTQFLAPTLRVVMLFSGGLFILGIAFLGVVKYLSDANTLGSGLASIFSGLKTKAQALAGMFRVAFSTNIKGGILGQITEYLELNKALTEAQKTGKKKVEFGGKEVSVDDLKLKKSNFRKMFGPAADDALNILSSDTIKSLTGFVASIRKTFSTLSQIVSAAMIPVSIVMGQVFESFGFMLYALTYPINLFIQFLNLFGSEINEVSAGLEFFGTVLGMVLAGFLLYKSVTIASSVIGIFYNSVVGGMVNMGTSFGRTKDVLNALNRSEAQHMSILDQVKMRTQMLTASKEKEAMIIESLKHKYKNLNQAQQVIHSKTKGISSEFANGYESSGEKITDAFDGIQDKFSKYRGGMMKVAAFSGIGSYALSMLNSNFLGNNETISMFTNGIMILAGVLPLLSAGFFSMAGAILAAVWPLLVVAGVLAGIYAVYRAFNKEDNSNKKKKSYTQSMSSVGAMATATPTSPSTVASISPNTVSSAGGYLSGATSSSQGVVNNNNNSKVSINRLVVEYSSKGALNTEKEKQDFANRVADTLKNATNNKLGGVGV